MAIETKKSFCRFCHANCAMEVDIEGGRVVEVRGDSSNEVYGGYTCLKGRAEVEKLYGAQRVTECMKRQEDGSFSPIPLQQAYDEIAAKIEQLIEDHGPRSVSAYAGSFAFQNSGTLGMAMGFMQAIKSSTYFTSVTVDQPAKVFMGSRFGEWGGGAQSFKVADVNMVVGCNPMISHLGGVGGVPPFSPSRRMRDAIADGLKLIVIDPRDTEMTRLAHVHLRVRPGEDPTLMAGIVKYILDNDLEDKEFCAEYVEDLGPVKEAIKDFTLDYVSKRTDVPAEDIAKAAEMFAAGPKGNCTSGTGPEMAGRGDITDHFIRTLNAICGRYLREGEEATVPKILTPKGSRRAQVSPNAPFFGKHMPQSRVRKELSQIGAELPCSTMADEILEPGEGQIRAMISIGGNPVVALPDQDKIVRAFESLELLVQIDVCMSETAKLAHYVFPAQVSFERDDMTFLSDWWQEDPYAHYTEKLVEPVGDAIEEYEFFWELSKRLRAPIELPGGTVTTNKMPTKFEILEKITAGNAVPLSQIRDETNFEGGKVFEEGRRTVEPRDENNQEKFRVGLSDMMGFIKEVRKEPLFELGVNAKNPGGETHILISQRLKQFFNSTGMLQESLRKHGTTNYAMMHPNDLKDLGIESDTLIEIEADAGTIVGVAMESNILSPGVIAMSHAFGGPSSNASNVREQGSSTNILASDTTNVDPYTGMPRQSAIPVKITPIPAAAE